MAYNPSTGLQLVISSSTARGSFSETGISLKSGDNWDFYVLFSPPLEYRFQATMAIEDSDGVIASLDLIG
jgi:hypothetical protein